MEKIFHPAAERGYADHGWLKARHSFSFANYYDPRKEQFGALRVLNDDHVEPSHGFGMHPHNNMEIVTIPLSGALRHKDNRGNEGVIRAGDVQIMSAGKGIMHAEFNASDREAVNLFQIWVFPKVHNIEPRYDQRTFGVQERTDQWQTVVSPDKESSALWINQDAWFSLGNFDRDTQYQLHLPSNGVYLMLIEGEAEIDGERLGSRDAIGIRDSDNFDIKLIRPSKLLAIEIPMT